MNAVQPYSLPCYLGRLQSIVEAITGPDALGLNVDALGLRGLVQGVTSFIKAAHELPKQNKTRLE